MHRNTLCKEKVPPLGCLPKSPAKPSRALRGSAGSCAAIAWGGDVRWLLAWER